MTLSADRWAQLSPLLDEAFELDGDARRPFIARLASTTPDLARDLEALLDAADGSGDFLERAVQAESINFLSDAADHDETADTPPDRLGPWRIVREIGRGGMGVVYLAERADGDFDQQVALKVIRRGLDSDEILARFRRERQILARLQHPAIASLIDGGVSPDGRPYVAMERVDGQPITTYAETARATFDNRLRLMLAACAAVQHAHANLVVHRDLKPSNILVTSSGQVKLLDFGIAQLLTEDGSAEQTALTRVGQRAMTLDYASPEQMRGEAATTATDIYGLGLVLYELLAGRRAQVSSGGARETGAREIVGLRGDLDTIVRTALHPDPSRRYASVEALSRDLERYLAGLPIAAHPDSFSYRAGKFIARHRAAVAVSAVVIVLLVGGIAATLWQARIAAREARKARAVTEFLTSIFTISDPSEARGAAVTAREILDNGARRIETELRDQPELQADMFGIVGGVYSNLGILGRAGELLQRALERTRDRYGPNHARTAAATERWAKWLWDKGDYKAAEQALRETLALQRRLLGSSDPAISMTLSTLAAVIGEQNKNDEALALHREALAMDRAIHGERDSLVATDLSNIGTVLQRMDRLDESESFYRQAIEMRRELREAADSPNMVLVMKSLAVVLNKKGDSAAATPIFQDVLARQKRLYGPNHPDIARTLDNLALAFERSGRLSEAIAAAREALDVHRRTQDPNHPDFAVSLNTFATTSYRLGAYADAEAALRSAIDLWTRTLGPEHRNVATAKNNLGVVLREKGDPVAAEPLLRESLALRRKIGGDESGDVAGSLKNLGLLLIDTQRYSDADATLRQAVDLARRVFPPSHPRLAEALVALGQLRIKQDKASEAEPLLREALDIRVNKVGAESPQAAEARMHLGVSLTKLKRIDEARTLLRSALEIRQKTFGTDSPQAAEVQTYLAVLAR